MLDYDIKFIAKFVKQINFQEIMKNDDHTLYLLILLLNFKICIGDVCDEDKWFCMDYVPVTQCKPCERNHLSSNVGNEVLNFINKFVCLSNIIQQPCVKGCISSRTYCNVMYKSIPETNFNVSLKMDISVKLVNRKNSQFLVAFGICDKLRRNPLCLFEAKVEAGPNFESLHVCINLCSDGKCKPFERHGINDRCESNFNVPFEKQIVENQNVISLLLTLDMLDNKAYLCFVTEFETGIREAKCIAQIDFLLSQVVFDLRRTTSKKDLYFLIHHHDQTYFNFNSNYLSIDSIYIYEDNLANRFKQPKVRKTIERVNKLVEDFYNTGQELCSNRHREFCEFPSHCHGRKQRCKTTSRSENYLVSSYLSNSQYVTFENTDSSFLYSVSVAIVNETKGSINFISHNQEIIESIFITKSSTFQGLEISIEFDNSHDKFVLTQHPSIVYTIKIQNEIGANCYFDQPSTVYFAYDHGVINLGSMKTVPSKWSGIFIDGFEDTLIIKDTYVECISRTPIATYVLCIIFLMISLVAMLGSVTFYYQRREYICMFIYKTYLKGRLNSLKVSIARRSKTPNSLTNQPIFTRNNQSSTSSCTEDPLCSQGNYTFCQNQNDLHPIESNSPEEDNAGPSRYPNKHILTTYGSTEEEIDIINCIRNLYYDSTV